MRAFPSCLNMCPCFAALQVLMVSHRWETPEHPDPHRTQLRAIRQHLNGAGRAARFVFYSGRCLNQDNPIRDLLLVNELYARAPTLCLATEPDYYARSWCLFELALALFNHGAPTVVGRDDHRALAYFRQARTVVDLGYVHALPEDYTVGPDVRLTLPLDRLHLKAQLRQLFVASQITKKDDMRIILNLLDQFVAER